MRILLLCGFKRCGKDTFANYVANKYGYTHLKISQQLKDSLQVLFGFTSEQMESDKKDCIDERWQVTPREVLQYMGTNIFQYEIQKLLPNIGRNFWIKTICQDIENKYLENKDTDIVISDLRFIHELNYINNLCRRYSGISVYIVKIIRADLKIVYDHRIHESESQHLQFQFDKIIQNDTKESFEKQIDEYMQRII